MDEAVVWYTGTFDEYEDVNVFDDENNEYIDEYSTDKNTKFDDEDGDDTKEDRSEDDESGDDNLNGPTEGCGKNTYDTVYSREELWATGSRWLRRRISENGGVCLGLSLMWISGILSFDEEPGNVWPDMEFSFSLQRYLQAKPRTVPYEAYPTLIGLSNGVAVLKRTVREGLKYVWNQGGTCLMIIAKKHPHNFAHAVAYSDQSSDGYGYVLNANTGLHRCYSYEGLVEAVYSDYVIRRVAKKGSIFTVVHISPKKKTVRMGHWREVKGKANSVN